MTTVKRSNSYEEALEMSSLPNRPVDVVGPASGSNGPVDSTTVHIEQARRPISLAHQPRTLFFSDVSFCVNVKDKETKQKVTKCLVQKASGVAHVGQITAILGPSGCGKTTLLDVLAGRVVEGRAEGIVTLDGQARDHSYKRVAAYVQQELLLQASLTVTETLAYAGRFRLPSSVSDADRAEMVDEVIDELGLRVCAQTRIGNAFLRGVSGGQKRRVAIGIELMARPSILFLDVPTSGLDSTAALALINSLRVLAERQRTIVLSLNQPNAKMFRLLDKVILMSKGKQLFYGSRKEALTFFADNDLPCPKLSNPADFFLDQINVDFPNAADINKLASAYEASPYYSAVQKALPAIHTTTTATADATPATHALPPSLTRAFANSWFSQLRTLLVRNSYDSLRNPLLYWLRVAMYTMLALMVGTLFINVGTDGNDIYDRLAVIFFIVAFFCFMTIALCPAAIDDRDVFVRERSAGSYRVSAFVVANTLSSLPWVFLIAFLSSLVSYFLIGLNLSSASRFFYFVFVLFLGLYAAESLVLTLSALVPFALVGIAVSSGVLGILVLLNGFFVTPDNIPGYFVWVYYANFLTYVLQALLYNDFAGLTFTNVFDPVTGSSTSISGEAFLAANYSIDSDIRGRNVAIIMAMIIIFRLLFWVVLYTKQTGKRK